MKLSQNDYTAAAALISHWLCYFNSAINPVIYNFMSGKSRRRALLSLLPPQSADASKVNENLRNWARIHLARVGRRLLRLDVRFFPL